MTMPTLTLNHLPPRSDDLLQLAEEQNVVIRTASGKLFLIAAVGEITADSDYEAEIARTAQQPALRELLQARGAEPATVSANEARKRLGLV
jgi:hypothetical protein